MGRLYRHFQVYEDYESSEFCQLYFDLIFNVINIDQEDASFNENQSRFNWSQLMQTNKLLDKLLKQYASEHTISPSIQVSGPFTSQQQQLQQTKPNQYYELVCEIASACFPTSRQPWKLSVSDQLSQDQRDPNSLYVHIN